jgi:hypothetical protein
MNFYEFIEALARVSEKASLVPPKGREPRKSVLVDIDEKR